MSMAITRDQVGEFTTVETRAPSHDRAVRDASREVRRAGYRVVDVASATRQSGGSRWRVELQVEPR